MTLLVPALRGLHQPAVGTPEAVAVEQYTGSDDLYISAAGDDDFGDGTSGNPWKTMGKALSVLRNRHIVDTVVQINVADGTYEDQDPFFVEQDQKAWADLRSIYLDERSALQITGNTTTPANVSVRGDTAGDTVAVRRVGVLLPGNTGRIIVEGIVFQYFQLQGIRHNAGVGLLAELDIKNVECNNIDGDGIELLSPIGDLNIQDVKCNNNGTYGLNISDTNSKGLIQGTCEFNNNGSNGILLMNFSTMTIGGFGTPIDANNNADEGIKVDHGKYLQLVPIVGGARVEASDNGSHGLKVNAVDRVDITEVSGGEIIFNRNVDRGILLENGVNYAQIDVASSGNVLNAAQLYGLEARDGAQVELTNFAVRGDTEDTLFSTEAKDVTIPQVTDHEVDVDFAAEASKDFEFQLNQRNVLVLRFRAFIDADPGAAFSDIATISLYSDSGRLGANLLARFNAPLVYTELSVATTGSDANFEVDDNTDLNVDDTIMFDPAFAQELHVVKSLGSPNTTDDNISAFAIDVGVVLVPNMGLHSLFGDGAKKVYGRMEFAGNVTVNTKVQLKVLNEN